MTFGKTITGGGIAEGLIYQGDARSAASGVARID
jgi:hypothetical protein